MNRRTRIVLIADDDAKLSPFRKRFHRHPQYQIVATTNHQEGLMVSEAMPADALVVAITLTPENANRVLADFSKRGAENKIPMHWIADETTRQTLDQDEKLDLQADTLLESSMSPEEVIALISPEPVASAARRPRIRLELGAAIDFPAAAAMPESPPDGDAFPVRRAARLPTTDGAFELQEKSLLRLVDKFGKQDCNGHLRIDHKEHTAQLHFDSGKPVHANFGALEGMAALVNFAHWQEGLARWIPRPDGMLPPPRTLDPNVVVGILRTIPSRKSAKT